MQHSNHRIAPSARPAARNQQLSFVADTIRVGMPLLLHHAGATNVVVKRAFLFVKTGDDVADEQD